MADPIPVPLPTANDLARFWAKVEKHDDGCWLWIGAKFVQGYGAFHLQGKLRRAHRVAYVWEHGELGLGFAGLDHICDTRACVNPAHLRPASAVENVLRGSGPTAENARRETCGKGHPLDYIDPRGWRGCSTCRDAAARRYQDRNREKINRKKREARAQMKGET